ncbi:hypothetical protein Nepgr_007306 [Nepenthes gracilis]|uniref:Uncharacterized protein n=1 Tax=Nepenthes gracilis TaxID=150966 RepID=A0AAD3S7E0_NEPGR|nr:hypothetical protein Nepgr_007306 [Nepenthes gracilis]
MASPFFPLRTLKDSEKRRWLDPVDGLLPIQFPAVEELDLELKGGKLFDFRTFGSADDKLYTSLHSDQID